MTKYSDYNIISIGDHCAVPDILRQLNLRKQSYPFDWVTNKFYYDTNIIYNIQLIDELNSSDNVDDIVQKYIGDAFINDDKVNSNNNIGFYHDFGDMTDIFEKYKRRFSRLKSVLNNKNIYILLTRNYYIEKDIFLKIAEQLLNYNANSIILFISGKNHTYFEDIKCSNIIFKYIEYDMSKLYDYDYTTFRPNIKSFLSTFLI